MICQTGVTYINSRLHTDLAKCLATVRDEQASLDAIDTTPAIMSIAPNTEAPAAQANGFHISPAPAEKTTYQVKEDPMRKPRKIKVIAIGAGASALCFGHEVNNSDLDIEFVAYDKNPVIGGTWYENRYPGYVAGD